MRIPWKLALVSALALTALLAIPAPASAVHQGSTQVVTLQVGENANIGFNNWTGYTFTLGSGDSIQYGIQSTSDNIDVFFFDPAGLTAYRNHPPQSSQAISALRNRTQFGGVWSSATGTITLVVDNVDFSGAVPVGAVTVQVGLVKLGGGTPNPDVFAGIIAAGILLCVGVVVAIVVVIVLIIWAITRSNRPPMPPPQPPYMPPPQQPWPPQPPQGGAPPGQYPPPNP